MKVNLSKSVFEKKCLEQKWVELPDSICWGECDEKDGQCKACETHDSDALAGYCCSGVNHHGRGGAVSNGDCPANAVAAVTHFSTIIDRQPECRFYIVFGTNLHQVDL